jgi:hypothetical protein
MQRMLKDAKPDRLQRPDKRDNALYQPGPMDRRIPTYIARGKQGKEVLRLPRPASLRCWKKTYGIMVYQEQVMVTAQTPRRSYSPAVQHYAVCDSKRRKGGLQREVVFLQRRGYQRAKREKSRRSF